MMTGYLNSEREPILSLHLQGANGHHETINAAIDTGFNDFLTLSPALIAQLSLKQRGFIRAMLGDGSTVSMPVYTVTLWWHGQPREVDVLATDSGSLIGMALLDGSRLLIDVTIGGQVVIEERVQPQE